MHTPGPWTAECVGSGGNYDNPTDVYEVTNGYKRIAEYLTEQDARLIAAAPQLLEALQDIVTICNDGNSRLLEPRAGSVLKAMEAIAAATGK